MSETLATYTGGVLIMQVVMFNDPLRAKLEKALRRWARAERKRCREIMQMCDEVKEREKGEAECTRMTLRED